MAKPKIGVIVGSLRRESINSRVACALRVLSETRAEWHNISIDRLPHYNSDLEVEAIEEVVDFRQKLRTCSALLFVTPEYNRSIPGVMKNAIDWASRPITNNALCGKPGAVIGASLGAIGTAAAQQHLRNILSPLEVWLMGQPETCLALRPDSITPEGLVSDPPLSAVLADFMDHFLEWIEQAPRVSFGSYAVRLHAAALLAQSSGS
jgi:chromate reductase